MGVVNCISDGQAARNLIVTGANISVFMTLCVNKEEPDVKLCYILY
jgi:hypothetical protein